MEDKSYVERVKELINLPQSLCRQCGQCCDVVIFKYGLAYDEIIELINNPDTPFSQVKGAKDFLSVFEPISSEKAQEKNPDFVKFILKRLNKPKEEVTFFHCRNLTNERKCSVHDKRPDLCRHYPVCYEDMFFYKGCGYEEQARKNWAEIEKILEKLGNNQ